VIVEDRPTMNVDSLASKIGGILSLWLGLSVMFVVEVTELIVCVVRDQLFKNTKTDEEQQNTHSN